MKTAFLFAGQGAQYPGMMKDLYEEFPEAKAVFDRADGVLGRSISALCFDGTQEDLNLTHNTQPCVFAADMAAFAVLNSRGVRAAAAAGFSLGEFAALAAAGVITLEDALRLVQLRADAMQTAVPKGQGAMLALIGCTAEEAESLCAKVTCGYVIAANYNCPGQTVVSGETEAVNALALLARECNLRAIPLPVSAPFHSKLMKPAADAVGNALRSITLSDPQVPVYMNVDGSPERSAPNIPGKLVRQAMSPVYWERTLLALARDGIDTFIEIGPGKALSGFVKKTLPGAAVYSCGGSDAIRSALSALANR